ncbi:MAG: hypothetical protein GX633_00650, partial [Clostridiales bacterium]|nr:hypothetical protein [Clostridiales bacterium]
MEKLYNNIVLPDVWPPREPCGSVPPYIKNPPEVIRLDEHSQLFVDDFFIESTNLTSCFHEAEKKGRVFYPETKWEKDESLPVATPKSGGVWKVDGKYKVWYEAGWVNQMAYAESEDGIHFIRPKLDIERGTNKILTYDKDAKDEKYFRPDSTTVFYDPKDTDGKYKLFIRNVDLGLHAPAIVALSDDGIHFRDFTLTSPVGDRSTMFYNPFRKKWVYSIRDYWQGRSRSYRECDNLITGAKWERMRLSNGWQQTMMTLPTPTSA